MISLQNHIQPKGPSWASFCPERESGSFKVIVFNKGVEELPFNALHQYFCQSKKIEGNFFKATYDCLTSTKLFFIKLSVYA